MLRIVPPIALLCLAVSCASRDNHLSVAALETRALVPASYQAELTGRAVKLSELSKLTAPARGTEDDEEGAPGPEGYVLVAARIVAMDAELAEGTLAWARHAKQALRVDRNAAEAFIDRLSEEGRVKEVNSPRIAVAAGVIGTISTTNQIAYIKSFELQATDHSLVADPQVGVAEEGYLLQVQPELPDADGFVSLALELVSITLERPIEVRESYLLGAHAAVSFQVPVTTSQRLGVSTRLGPEDALVLGGLATTDADVFLFAFVSCDPLAEADLK